MILVRVSGRLCGNRPHINIEAECLQAWMDVALAGSR
jgi:hypothetical protein